MPLYLADRQLSTARFKRYLDNYPEVSTNVRITGLRGVGKSVLLKEYKTLALAKEWVVINRDMSPRLVKESDFAQAFTFDIESAANSLSKYIKAKSLVTDTIEAARNILSLEYEGVKMSAAGKREKQPQLLEDAAQKGLCELGKLAAKTNKGVVFLYDEAQNISDQKHKHQFSLSALLSAFVKAQDEGYPVMLVMCGLPAVRENLQSARSHSERLFKAEELGHLSLENNIGQTTSEAVLALTKPAEQTGIDFDLSTAEQIVTDVGGYPYFIQKYGEALWDVAHGMNVNIIDNTLYKSVARLIQSDLDKEFYEGRFNEPAVAEQDTLLAAGSLGKEEFRIADLILKMSPYDKSAKGVGKSIEKLLAENLIFRVRVGLYAYTAPRFGDFLRRKAVSLGSPYSI